MSATSSTAAPITIDGGGPVGELLRAWRTKRRVSQLDLATKAEVSTRHLSFIETGRSKPSSDMVLHLAAHLDVPLRGRDELLVAAGFAPRFARGGIQSVELAPIRGLLDTILASYQSTPAIVVDRHWNVEAMNDAAGFFATLVDPDLLDPLNVMRLTLHPDGLAGHLVNRAAVSEHLLGRLRSQVDHTGDPVLADLLDDSCGTRQPTACPPWTRWRHNIRPTCSRCPSTSDSTTRIFGSSAPSRRSEPRWM